MNIFCTIITTEPEKARLALGTKHEDGTITPSGHFQVGLSSDGYEPPTHFISSGIWDDEEITILDNSGIDIVKVYDGEPQLVLNEQSLEIINV